jgi:hypothetical protein
MAGSKTFFSIPFMTLGEFGRNVAGSGNIETRGQRPEGGIKPETGMSPIHNAGSPAQSQSTASSNSWTKLSLA